MATTANAHRPAFIQEEHLDFLDELFECYALDMRRATPLLEKTFRLNEPEARATIAFWEKSFGQRLSV